MERYVVHVTKRCELACTYCYEQDKQSEYTWEEIKELIDKIVLYNKEKRFDIEYLGGEPLLAFDLIKKATEYMESLPDVEIAGYGITTNGTILTDEIVEFLKRHPKVRWHASMDGTKWMNQLRVFKDSRINTHDIVLKNHHTLEMEIGTDRIGIHMVTHPFNVAWLAKGIDHLYNHGVRNIGVGTVESTMTIGKEYCDRFIKELDVVSEKVCNGEYPGLNVDLFNWLKPRSDTRYYMKDPVTNKTIAESYGRSESDIMHTEEYNAYASSSALGTLIDDIREIVYTNHQKRLGML